MATATSSTQNKTSKSSTKAKSTTRTAQPDAIKLLKDDHREVEGWFDEFKRARADTRKSELAAKICLALKVHTQIEEEIFYPASRQVLQDDSIVDEAVVEHDSAKKLIAEIEQMKPGDDLYDAKVTVLSEIIEHHVKEEEKEYFPRVRKTDLDLKSMGQELMARKEELMGKMAPDGAKSVH
ncbi:MAG: hemerythrin domain-containing protein [Phenylobacterium sp.]|uniref:hemerythrin domain-containing protein n=1 Tax=Phenylobacterium sp. TaxID=1871053 RepID=UPI00391AC9E4